MPESKFSFDGIHYPKVQEREFYIDPEITERVWRWFMLGNTPTSDTFENRIKLVAQRALTFTVNYILDQGYINPQEATYAGHNRRILIGLWLLEQGVISPETVANDMEKSNPEIWEKMAELDTDHIDYLRAMIVHRTDEISAITRGQDFDLMQDHSENNSSSRSPEHARNYRLAGEIQSKLFPGTSKSIRGAIFGLYVGLATGKIEYVQTDAYNWKLQLGKDNSQRIRRDIES